MNNCNLLDMEKDIVIAGGGVGEDDESDFERFEFGRTKSLDPTIETCWHHAPSPEEKKVSSSSSSLSPIKSLWSSPFKFRDSLKRLRRSKSLQMVLEGPHEPRDEHLVESFREMLFLEGILPTTNHNDYHTLLRFLRMRDFDMTKSKDVFLNYLKWREQFRVDMLPKEFKFTEYEEVKKCYPHGYHGVDRYGRPVYIERLGMVDLNKLLQVTTIERLVKHHVSEQEKTQNIRYPASSLTTKQHIASTTSILDVNGVGMSNFSKSASNLFMEIQKIDSNFYPETLNKAFIINAGPGFRMLWKAVKTFLDVRTATKIEVCMDHSIPHYFIFSYTREILICFRNATSVIQLMGVEHIHVAPQVLGSNYLSVLLEAIDPSNLPSFLGGNCTCSDYGGCLMSDRGPWNNQEVLEMIQAISSVELEDINDEGENGEVASEDSMMPKNVDIENEDDFDMSLGHEEIACAEACNACKLALEKINGLEAALGDTKNKIMTLEKALEDTKMMLKELAQHIEKPNA